MKQKKVELKVELNAPFTGRDFELSQLRALERIRTASLVVIQGRRRIGKSRLIQEFCKEKVLYEFTGLAPDKKTTAQSQRNEFAIRFKNIFNKQLKNTSEWSEILAALAKQTKNRKCIILLDEITWMGSLDPDFVGKLKIAWDLYFSKNNNLILVFCGSISWWIEDNILSSTAFFGRINAIINLQELSLAESAKLLRHKKSEISEMEILKILSVTGGVPRYIELIDTSLSAEDNIKNLCFIKNSTLLNEYQRIFSDIFGKKDKLYEKIISVLLTKKLTLTEVASKLKVQKSVNLIKQLRLLKISGFIDEDYSWDIKNRKITEIKTYRLKDNYLRFYLKYLKPNLPIIEQGMFKYQSLHQLPGLESIFGLQFENLVINNQDRLFRQIGVEKSDILFHGPYLQRQTIRKPGCQIDYLIQTKQRNMYLCEIKFKRDPIGSEVIKDVERKYKAIVKPRNVTYRFVLISAAEVKQSVYDTGFFDRIITTADLI